MDVASPQEMEAAGGIDSPLPREMSIMNVHSAQQVSARNGHAEWCLKLLDTYRITLSSKDDLALKEAVYFNHPRVVQVLLDRGADRSTNHSKNILIAASLGDVEVIDVLLRYTAVTATLASQILCTGNRHGHRNVVEYARSLGGNPAIVQRADCQ